MTASDRAFKQGNPRGGSGPPPPRLPKDYLRNSYFDSQDNIFPEVIQTWANEIAGHFVRGGITTSQLRRFFGKARHIEQKLQSQPFDSLKGEIESFKPLAAYTVGRNNAPNMFKEFIDVNVQEAVKSEHHFRDGFLVHLQSIVGYARYIESRRGGR